MILVTGATGNIGSELVPLLLDLNQEVRVLLHDSRKVALWGDRVEYVVGDFDKPSTLDAAVKGVDQVFLLTFEIGAGQGEAMMKASRKAGVRHVVYVSSLTANYPNLTFGQWHHDREEAVRASGLTWTILRGSQFMANALQWGETIKTQGTVYFPGGEGRSAVIDPGDIAALAALTLTRTGEEGKVYEITGGELLTLAQQVEILSQALGKPICYVDIPPSALREGMLQRRMPPVLVEALVELFTFIRDGHAEITTTTFEQVVGRKPRTFAAWCRAHRAAF
jgi:uncharacterized protein YbjT (DUF2867 family)